MTATATVIITRKSFLGILAAAVLAVLGLQGSAAATPTNVWVGPFNSNSSASLYWDLSPTVSTWNIYVNGTLQYQVPNFYLQTSGTAQDTYLMSPFPAAWLPAVITMTAQTQGTVSAASSPVTLTSGAPPTSGTLVYNEKAYPLNVTGSLSVSGTATFGGSVSITNPATAAVQIAGSVTNTVSTLSWVSGTANVADNNPATQNVTVTDTASVNYTGANGQNIVTGTATANSSASFALNSWTSVRVQVSGVWSGTLVTEVSIDSGLTWTTLGMHQPGVSTANSTFTSNFVGLGNVSGATNFRVRATAFASGTAVVRVVESVDPGVEAIMGGVKIVDSSGTTSLATVKYPGIASISSDTALVTALSPNTPLPVGTNQIGNVSISGTAGSALPATWTDITITTTTPGSFAAGCGLALSCTAQPCQVNVYIPDTSTTGWRYGFAAIGSLPAIALGTLLPGYNYPIGVVPARAAIYFYPENATTVSPTASVGHQ